MWTAVMVCEAPTDSGRLESPVAIDETEARELNAIAGVLEGLAVGVAPALDSRAIVELRVANDEFRLSLDASSLAVADHDFHSRLVERCGDEPLLEMLAPVREALYRWQAALAPDPAEIARAADEHDAIVEALARGDRGAAAQRVREHVAAGLPGLLGARAPA